MQVVYQPGDSVDVLVMKDVALETFLGVPQN